MEKKKKVNTIYNSYLLWKDLEEIHAAVWGQSPVVLLP